MQNRILILISATAVAISASAQVGAIDLNRPHSEHHYEQEHEKRQKYTCPMHPEVVTEQPGNCPKCGMKLVPIEEKKKYSAPINREHVHDAQRSTPNHQSHMSHQSHSTHSPSHGSGAAGEHQMMTILPSTLPTP
jgi:uncharacterized C2H2 Zn-finger protein